MVFSLDINRCSSKLGYFYIYVVLIKTKPTTCKSVIEQVTVATVETLLEGHLQFSCQMSRSGMVSSQERFL